MTWLVDFPDEYYIGLGRVTVSAALLEVMLAWVVVEATGSQEDYVQMAGSPRQVMQKLEKVARERGPEHEIHQLHAEALQWRGIRDRYVHALVVERGPAEDPTLALHHPRSGEELMVPSAEDWRNLDATIIALAIRAAEIAQRLADNLRTTEDH